MTVTRPCTDGILFLILILSLGTIPASGQNRDLRSERIVLDDNGADGTWNTLTLDPQNLTANVTLMIPQPTGATGEFLISNPMGSTNQTIDGPLTVEELRIADGSGSFYTSFLTGTQTANLSYTWPTAAPTAGQVLTSTAAGVLSWVDVGLDSFTEAYSTTAPNATIPVASLTATGTATHIDAAFIPKGGGALLADVPDGGASGGNKRGSIAVDLQMSRSAATEVASGARSVISGGIDNAASGSESTVGGGQSNSASSPKATIAGGLRNEASGPGSTVGGGADNVAGELGATVGGGESNEATDSLATIAGGWNNTASSLGATVSGGRNNSVSQIYATIGGGSFNIASDSSAAVGGGSSNSATGRYSTISGGQDNRAWAFSTVGGGAENQAYGDYGTIAGGSGNRFDPVTSYGTIAGGWRNTVLDNFGSIGGGVNNTTFGGARYATIAGGSSNTVFNHYATVGGGERNSVTGEHSVIPGGYEMTVSGNGSFGFQSVSLGRTMSVAAPNTAVFGNADLWLANNDNAPSELRFYEAYNTAGAFPNTASYTGFKAPTAMVSGDVMYTLPTAAPTSSGQVLSSTTGGVMSWVDRGLTNFAEGYSTTIPNTTEPVASLTASGTETDIDAAFVPKGTGALLASVPDNTVTGGNKRGVRAVDLQMSRTTATQVANGNHATIGGGTNNSAAGTSATVGGGDGNTASVEDATVAGGTQNTVSGRYGAIGGGRGNQVSAERGFVGGGQGNITGAGYSTIAGGRENRASALYTTVAGGYDNTASGVNAAVGGGEENQATGDNSAIPGGHGLTLSGSGSFGFLGGNAGLNDMNTSAVNTALFGNADLWLANNDNAPSELRFYEAYNTSGAFPNGANYTAFKAAATQAADVTYTLPTAAPTTNGQVLASQTDGTMSWVDGPTGAQSFSNGSATVPTLELSNTNATGVGLEIADGRMIASASTANSAGGTVPSDVMIARVGDNATASNAPATTLPTTVADGQILYLVVEDPDGATFTGTTLKAGAAPTADGLYILVYYNDGTTSGWAVTR